MAGSARREGEAAADALREVRRQLPRREDHTARIY